MSNENFEFLYNANLTASELVDQLGAILDADEESEVEGFDAVNRPKDLRRHLIQLLNLGLILDHRDAQLCVMDSFEVRTFY